MSLLVSFIAAQSPVSPNIIILSDTSSGTDGAVVGKRVYITNALGQYITPTGNTTNYIIWSLSDSTIPINILTEDTACYIFVEWVNSDGTALYTDSNTFCFSEYNKQFAYSLVQGLVPPVTLNTNYSSALASLWVSIKGAINAIEFASDIQASQNCLNQGTYLRLNQQYFY